MNPNGLEGFYSDSLGSAVTSTRLSALAEASPPTVPGVAPLRMSFIVDAPGVAESMEEQDPAPTDPLARGLLL